MNTDYILLQGCSRCQTSSLGPSEFSSVDLVVNGQVVVALFPHTVADYNNTGSSSAVVSVYEGDGVYLRTKLTLNHGDTYT